MNKFVVFECNRLSKNRRARIHRASCGHAKEPNYKTASSLCHGYFERYYEAMDFSKSLNLERVYDCELCSPRHASELARAKKEAED